VPADRDSAGDPDLDDLARDAGDAARRVSGAVAGVTLVVLHAVVGSITLTLGVVAPGWAVAALLLAWAAIGVTAWRWRARRPIVAMLAPFVAAALDIGAVALGEALLGWRA
jgi:hypothetical protein